jgi:hypothetical protein
MLSKGVLGSGFIAYLYMNDEKEMQKFPQRSLSLENALVTRRKKYS